MAPICGNSAHTSNSLAFLRDSRYIAARLVWERLREEPALASLEEVAVGGQVGWLLILVWRK